MKIILDENKKEGVLVKNDGTEVSRYPYRNLISEDFTFEDFKKDIDGFNQTLEKQEEFDNIKNMYKCVTNHNFDE